MPDDAKASVESGEHGASAIQSVKGLTFLTAKRHFHETIGKEAFEELIAPLDPQVKELFDSALIDEFYPEAMMRVFIHRIFVFLAERDDERFCQIARDLALAGVSRFFRVVINLASARFVLKKVPIVWKRLREGPAELHTEVEDDRIRIFYTNFEYCHDHVYRLLSMSNCQALVVAATGKVPLTRVVTWTDDTMCLEFLLPGKHEEAPESWAADVYGGDL